VLYVNGAKGGVSLVADANERMVHHPGGDWTLLWPAGLAPGSAPSPTKKYTVHTMPGQPTLGRTTSLVELSRKGAVRERLYLDDATGLVLRRDQLDAQGNIRRQVKFDSLQLGGKVRTTRPQSSATRAPKRVNLKRLPSAYRVPSGLAGGYQRTGTFKNSGTVHAVYSDGLYGLSVFEQPGRLDTSSLPAGRATVAVGETQGWHWTWAGGDVLLWEMGRTVYTAVGDGPYDDLIDAARSLPSVRAPSALGRLRSACHELLTSLG
jgi:sigma-E factor negative regulatory protein RseB